MVDAVRCVAPVGDRCVEGTVWHAAEQALYWTDINRFLVHRYDERAGAVKSWHFDEPVVALALTSRDDTLVVALGSRLLLWEPASDARRDHGFRLPGWPNVRLNDGRADPRGRFWIGSMRNNVSPDGEAGEAGGSDGKLFRIEGPHEWTAILDGIGIANTLCWSPDARQFYFADTLANAVHSFDYDGERGELSNRRPFFVGHERGVPDGSAIDADGFLWNCRYFGRSIVRIAPDGRIDRVVEMPVRNVTTCTFGGEDLRTLYITSAALDRDRGDRLAGSLFALRVAVPGLPENRVNA